MRPISGAVKAKLATVPPGPTPSWWRQQRVGSNRRLPCYSIWPSSTSMSGTTTSGKKAGKTRFPTRLLACWCASYEGWRFLEADKCATFPFWAFGTILPGCSGATTAAKLMLATLLETVATRLPTYRLWNVVDDISGHVAGTPKMVQVLTAEAARLLVEVLQARDLPLSKGKSKVLIDGPDKPKHCPTAAAGGARDRRERFGTQRGGRFAAGQAAAGTRRQGPFWRGLKRTRRVRQLRKAGAHTGKLTLTGSNAGVLWGSEVLGFTPTQLQSIRVDAAKATYRLSRGQNADGSLGRHPRPRHHAGRAARLTGQAQSPRTQRPPSCSRSIAWVGARSQRGTSRPTTAPRSTSWQLRPKRWAFGWTRHPFCGLTALHTGISPRARCSGKPSGHSSFLANWKAGHFGIGTCSSSWSHGTQERLARLRSEDDGSCQLCNDGPGTMFHRCYECPALQTERDMYVSQEVRVAARAWVLNTGSSLHTAFFLILAPFFQQVFPNASARCTGTIGPQMGCWRGTFSQTALRRAAGRCDGLAGQLWRSTMQETSMRRRMERYRATFCLGSPPDYAAAMAGQFTLDPLTLYIDCEGTIATINGPKHKALGAQGPRAHVWNRLLFSHDEVRAVKVKGHATERDVEAGRTSHLCKRGNDLADTFAKKGADTHKPAFRVAKTVVACASLAKQAARWAAEAHVLLRFRGGTTPGLLRHDHGYGSRERDSSESGRRRLLRRLQVRFLTGFLPFSPHVSRRTVTWTLAHSEGTACNWDEFPMLEAELWTTPSSFAPSVERSTGSVRMLSAANAANSQGAERRSCAN